MMFSVTQLSLAACGFQVGDRISLPIKVFGRQLIGTATLTQAKAETNLIADYEVVLPPIVDLPTRCHGDYPPDGVYQGRLPFTPDLADQAHRIDFEPGTQVQIIAAAPGLDDDLGRLGIVQPLQGDPSLQQEIRVLLEGDRCIRRFFPQQLSRSLPSPLQSWQETERTASALVPSADESWIESCASEAQQDWIKQQQQAGWLVGKRQGLYCSPLELEIELKQEEFLQVGLLSAAAGWTTVNPAAEINELDVERLEAELLKLQAEEQIELEAGGMQWPREWHGVSVVGYTTQKTLKNGAMQKFYYHRLECHRAIFPKRSRPNQNQKHTSPYAKRLHLANNEYARYRAAKYRYDQRHAIEKRLEQIQRQCQSPQRTLIKRNLDNHAIGEWKIIDTREHFSGEYPNKTFAFVVSQLRLVRGNARWIRVKAFKEIPVDCPERIEKALRKARAYLNSQNKD